VDRETKEGPDQMGHERFWGEGGVWAFARWAKSVRRQSGDNGLFSRLYDSGEEKHNKYG